jgi:hypothetical protein
LGDEGLASDCLGPLDPELEGSLLSLLFETDELRGIREFAIF